MAVIRTPPNLFARPRVPLSNKEFATTLLLSNLLFPTSLLLVCSIFYFYWDGVTVEHIFYVDFSTITLMASLCLSVFSLSIIFYLMYFLLEVVGLEDEASNFVILSGFIAIVICVAIPPRLFRNNIISNLSFKGELITNQWYGIGSFLCFLLLIGIIWLISRVLEEMDFVSNSYNLIRFGLLQYFLLGMISLIFGKIIWDKMPIEFIFGINFNNLSLLSSLLINSFIFSCAYFLISKFNNRFYKDDFLIPIPFIIASSYFLSKILRNDTENSYVLHYEIVQSYDIFIGISVSSIFICCSIYLFIKKELGIS